MIQDFAKWNKRAAAVYALGVWGMIGSYAYLKYTGHYSVPGKSHREVAVGHASPPVHGVIRLETVLFITCLPVQVIFKLPVTMVVSLNIRVSERYCYQPTTKQTAH